MGMVLDTRKRSFPAENTYPFKDYTSRRSQKIADVFAPLYTSFHGNYHWDLIVSKRSLIVDSCDFSFNRAFPAL